MLPAQRVRNIGDHKGRNAVNFELVARDQSDMEVARIRAPKQEDTIADALRIEHCRKPSFSSAHAVTHTNERSGRNRPAGSKMWADI